MPPTNEQLQNQLRELRAELARDKITESFAQSKFIADRLAVPASMVRDRFANSFEVVDGQVLGKDADGHRILSRARPGEIATFDEAIQILIGSYEHRDRILKGTGASGGGARAGNGSMGAKTMSRDMWERLPPEERRDVLVNQKMTLVD